MAWQNLQEDLADMFSDDEATFERDWLLELKLRAEHEKDVFNQRESQRIRRKSYANRFRTCKECGKKWTTEIGPGRYKDYCTQECQIKSAVRRRPGYNPAARSCIECFGPIARPKPRKITCSVKCAKQRDNRRRRKQHGSQEADDEVKRSGNGGEDGLPTGTDQGRNQVCDGGAPDDGSPVVP